MFFSCQSDKSDSSGQVLSSEVSSMDVDQPRGADNLAYKWAHKALDATAWDTDRFAPRPTITSRYLALTMVAMYDAWSVYDPKSKSIYYQTDVSIPPENQILDHKEAAVSYAAYEALKEYYYSDSTRFRDYMVSLGFVPDTIVNDPLSPIQIGRSAAQAVIKARMDDGANQYGEEEGSDGEPYFNYTGYKPINSPDSNVDINRWQPKYFINESDGSLFAPGCLTPYWQHVEPITLDTSSQFRSPPPPIYGDDQLRKEVAEVVEMQANLTPEQIALVEFMRDGPQSVQQAGHWLKFAQEVSVRDSHTLDQDIEMYLLVELAAMDGFIASWDTKMYYDYARPYALVHKYFEGDTITGWAGPGKGFKKILGEDWMPYSPPVFLCPPFPSYVSGHSTISGACAEVLRLYKGDDAFGSQVTLQPGALTEPNPSYDSVTLHFPTFTETAEMAGISRVLGGYHIQADNIEGLRLGRQVARHVYDYVEDLKVDMSSDPAP
ncbi:MAG: phosphatase PAP2 family protein [Bacteroidetes bacterium]|nr:phosphatase PAP2 family protein [Bacteroidota bacterium]